MVTPITGQNISGLTADGVAPLLTDPQLAQQVESLAYEAYNHCTTPQQVQAVTAQIVAALAYAGLPTSGPLMDFINQLAAQAKDQIGATGTANISAATGPTLTDPDLANEVQTLATEAFGMCQTPEQVQGILQSIGGSLGTAGLPTTGPLVDYLGELALGALQRIALNPPPQQTPTLPSPADENPGLWA